MKNLIEKTINSIDKNRYIIILSIIIIGIFIMWWMDVNNWKKELWKKDIEIQELKTIYKKAIELVEKPSQIERLWFTANAYKLEAEWNLEQIKQIKETHIFNTITYKCFKDQVNRLMSNQEVDEEYCMIEWNLEQYKEKK